mmetsp:Transcript_7421/g.8392  ORF Transcript_7421/g.8392 Transcript_7421/m.8392 type:complete len:95 (+) Transcript_7421:323-607(+)
MFLETIIVITGDGKIIYPKFNKLPSAVKDVFINILFQQGMPSFKKNFKDAMEVMTGIIEGEYTNSDLMKVICDQPWASVHKQRMVSIKFLLGLG